jgi:hypothetical protein
MAVNGMMAWAVTPGHHDRGTAHGGEAVITLDVPLAWTPGEQTEVPVLIVYAIVTGSGFVVVFGTALVAWWLNRRVRRREAGLLRPRKARVPRPRRARRVNAATAAPVERPDIESAADGPVEVVSAPSFTAAVLRESPPPAEIDLDRPTARRASDPRWTNEASGEYMLLRAATARAQTVAGQARHTSRQAADVLDTAERVYEEARRAHVDSLAATPVASSGSDRDAALDADRGGPLPAEDVAEQRTRDFRAAEVRARQEYHIALARAHAARQAEYVADTAMRALGAETSAAATELAAVRDNARPKRKWLRGRTPATATPAAAPTAPAPAPAGSASAPAAAG